MRLNTKKGSKVRFLGRNGYDHQLEKAMSTLVVGAEYEVLGLEVGGWSSTVILEPGRFNSVMFENVDG